MTKEQYIKNTSGQGASEDILSVPSSLGFPDSSVGTIISRWRRLLIQLIQRCQSYSPQKREAWIDRADLC